MICSPHICPVYFVQVVRNACIIVCSSTFNHHHNIDMSARAPFIPGGSNSNSRPASRVSHLKDQQQNSNTTEASQTLHFPKDPTSSLHAPPTPNTNGEPQLQLSTSSPKIQTANANKPLNTGSLTKRKNGKGQGHPFSASRRPSFADAGNAANRTRTANVLPSTTQQHDRDRDQSLKIVAPIPRPAPRPSSPTLSSNLASGVFTIATSSSFKTPALPASSISQIPSPAQDAHTPTVNTALGFSFAKKHSTTQLPSPPISIRPASRLYDSLDQTSPFSSNATGPQRIIINEDGTTDLDDNNDSDQNAQNQLYKRQREEELDYGQAKRYKIHQARSSPSFYYVVILTALF